MNHRCKDTEKMNCVQEKWWQIQKNDHKTLAMLANYRKKMYICIEFTNGGVYITIEKRKR